MAGDSASKKKRTVPWQAVQIVGTLLVALGGLYLSIQQGKIAEKQHSMNEQQQKLSQKLEGMKATGVFVDTVEEYLEKASIDEDSRKELLIALLAIITQSNLSSTGELTEDEKRRTLELMPYHFALVVQNHDMLAHIGYEKEQRDIWVPFAKNSGNMKFKTIAIKALAQIGRVSDEPEDLKYAVREISNLTRDGQLHDIVPEALTAIKELLAFMDDEQLRSKDNQSLLEDTLAMLESISTELIGGQSVREEEGSVAEKLKLNEEQVLALKEESVKMAQDLSSKLKLSAPKKGSQIKKNLEELKSGDKKTRLDAKSSLARAGGVAVPSLFEEYEKNKKQKRLKSGLVASLYLMEEPIKYEEAQIASLTALIGDEDAMVRMNAVGTLQKIRDREMIRLGAPHLFEWLSNTRNKAGLHNAVVILCEWDKDPSLRTLRIKDKLKGTSKLLADSGEGWDKTLARIDSHLNPTPKK